MRKEIENRGAQRSAWLCRTIIANQKETWIAIMALIFEEREKRKPGNAKAVLITPYDRGHQ